jgi:putative ubiquitin-RnfH superfamily antitoxin RatB of RatAB toxin-antitoxin module
MSTPSGGRSADRLRVTVAWASPRAQGLAEVDLPPGATVGDAVAAARAVECSGVEPGLVGFAIFGQTARPGTPVADGDRVEITRPLVADPRAARRDRAAAHPLPPGGNRQKRPTRP